MTFSATSHPNVDELVVGVVIEVPEPWGEDLTQWRIGFGDPHAEKIVAHITLLPPTRMSVSAFERMCARLLSASEHIPVFDISLGPIATFRPVSPVVYLQAHADADILAHLHEVAMDAADSPARRHPFVPHCTVAMDVPDAVLDAAADALADYAARWRVTALSILTRDEHGCWHSRAVAPLAGQ